MMAERFPSLLSPLSNDEILDVVKIHSVAGLPIEGVLQGERPFRAPHHLISDAGLIGGGTTPGPGEITLAHNGVLFLDEFPEYRRGALEALRAPLESGVVTISRAKGSWAFPARFQLIAAMNPCPCGRLGVRGATCLCSQDAIQGYLRKLSQPILDRIDLHVELEAVPISVISGREESRDTEVGWLSELACARLMQSGRGEGVNALLPSDAVMRSGKLTQGSIKLLERAADKTGLSARGAVRVLRVARTIADLANLDTVREEHIAEALSYRSLDRIKRYCQAA